MSARGAGAGAASSWTPGSSAAAAAAPAHPADFDKSIFSRTLPCVAVRVPTPATELAMRLLRGTLIEMKGVRAAWRSEELELAAGSGGLPTSSSSSSSSSSSPPSPFRLLLLSQTITKPDLSDATPQQKAQIEKAREALRAHSPAVPSAAELLSVPVPVGYDNLPLDDVLRRLLPADVIAANSGHVPAGFEIIGHIAHLNLRDELVPWRFVIGRAVLDKNPFLRTVVNKTGNIETVFRTFPMEVIAGVDDTVVEMRHCGALFSFDFRSVYWNSRLQHEHETLVSKHIPPRALVADMFCGVGPFAAPLAMAPHMCTVHANDLNPASVAALLGNVQRNRKVVEGRVRPYNMDGRAFIRHLAGRARVPFEHVIMNLPADALAFCDVFVGLFRHGEAEMKGVEGGEGVSGASSTSRPLPRIHVYCFSRAEEEVAAADDVAQRVLKVLQMAPVTVEGEPGAGATGAAAVPPPPPPPHPSFSDAVESPYVLAARQRGGLPDLLVRSVRNVAPAKLMMCVSFTLPRAVALAAPVVVGPLESPPDLAGLVAPQKKSAGGPAGDAGGPAAKRARGE
jgi:tRNA G37 N-methylase Trm5